MPTVNQLVRKPRQRQRRKRNRILAGRPFRKGVVTWAGIFKPRKPNSSSKKVCRVRFPDGQQVVAYIPGEGHNVSEHSQVLVMGGRVQDLSGVNHVIVRGVLDCLPPNTVNKVRGGTRNQARSKYGQKKN